MRSRHQVTWLRFPQPFPRFFIHLSNLTRFCYVFAVFAG